MLFEVTKVGYNLLECNTQAEVSDYLEKEQRLNGGELRPSLEDMKLVLNFMRPGSIQRTKLINDNSIEYEVERLK